jgi:SAM-dependent methyltransferase
MPTPQPTATSPKMTEKLHDLSKLLVEPAGIPTGLPRCRHEFEGLWPAGEAASIIRGWASILDGPWTHAELYLNGEKTAKVEPWKEREDFQDFLTQNAHTPFMETAPFWFWLPIPSLGANETVRVDVVLYRGDKPVARIWTPMRADITQIVPIPPQHLMKRVIGTDNANYFLRFALTCFGQYMAAAGKHKDLKTVQKMLDWGCGCGRVSAHYLRVIDGPAVTGCDIDGEDIAWCNENLRDGRFVHSSPFVPLPFEDGEFDLVVSLSVMTHLTKDQQNKWLKEIDRILAPGGLFVCSVHGAPAARAMPHPFLIERLLKEGFYDDLPDQALDNIAPEGYYRNTYQNMDYTRKSFGKFFEVLDVLESGVGIQDLVTARKLDKPKGFMDRLRA